VSLAGGHNRPGSPTCQPALMTPPLSRGGDTHTHAHMHTQKRLWKHWVNMLPAESDFPFRAFSCFPSGNFLLLWLF
jgi:hypothetical protein